ncbi:HPr family phosphocarrier protein [Alicyclobacillus macrosporangiidus]|jgi:phosphotransferase system HPr (HPr) family protein|uniref:Phosphocarrier protein HPr n=1 Tax=Alicyclobacillus macrosporangiidus TaxID=392015 RepID=A0A1I7GZD4_9BACL|nr:HPr family phosphocarrier protein [Alicyclobacillus macrosporangiidus]SFU53616.1 phosphocarrier protein [Alicyclobacillus macrosporangiidus]
MVEQTVTLNNRSGLHARPATLLVREAGKHPCNVWIRKGDKEVDAKSILGVMSLAVGRGETITVRADGSGEEAALKALVELIESGLGEA